MKPARFGELVLARLASVEAALVAARWPAISPWWRETLSRFMGSTVVQLVARVGRRGGKSSTAVVFGVAFALVYASLGLVPPGDVGYVVFVSARRDEALARLRGIERILGELGIEYAGGDGDAIVMAGTNIGFRVLSCNVASVSGWTTILAVADECAKWMNSETGQNPAAEVLAALRPTMATQALARMMMISSPLGTLDEHARAFDQGTNEFQHVAYAQTWIANPTLTEEATRRLEPDERIWRREYAAEPQGSLSACFDIDQIAAAFARERGEELEYHERPIMAVDVSSALVGGDAFTFAIAHYERAFPPPPPEGVPTKIVRLWNEERSAYDEHSFWQNAIGEWHPAPEIARPVSLLVFDRVGAVPAGTRADDAVAMLGDEARRGVEWGGERLPVSLVVGDQRESFSMSALFRRIAGRRFVELPWTGGENGSKARSVLHMRRLLHDGAVVLPTGHEVLRTQLVQYSERITRSGSLTWAGSGRRDDAAAVCLTTALADSEGLIPGSPIRRGGERYEVLERRF